MWGMKHSHDYRSSDSEFGEDEQDLENNLYALLYFGDNEEETSKTINVTSIRSSAEHESLVKECSETNTTKDISCSKLSQLVQAGRDEVTASSRKERCRLSSICSDGSIPGSVPLDELYCTAMSPVHALDVIDEEVAILESNSIKTRGKKVKNKAKSDTLQSKALKRKRKENTIGKASKRQKNLRNDDAASEDDSRYSLVTKGLSKKHSAAKSNDNQSGSSEFEESICIVPPLRQSCEVVTVRSSGSEDDCLHGDKQLKNGTKATSAHATIDLVSTSSIEEINSDSSLRKGTKRSGSTNEVRRNSESSSENLSSDSDSESEYEPELTNPSTNLTFGVDTYMSNLISQYIDVNDGGNEGRSKKDSAVTQPPVNESQSFGEETFVPDLIKQFNSNNDVIFIEERKVARAQKTGEQLVSGTKSTCDTWTKEMSEFYDCDITETFRVEDVHAKQSNKQGDWTILAADRQVKVRKRYYNREPRCTLCREFGHLQRNCTRVPRCHLCAQTDHTGRYRCPQNCCFRCGQFSHVRCFLANSSVVCRLCKVVGHDSTLCPDLWRRYHLTTKGEQVEKPTCSLERPPEERWCCHCTGRGHYIHQCSKVTSTAYYMPVPMTVFHYDPSIKTDNGYMDIVEDDGKKVRKDIRAGEYTWKKCKKNMGFLEFPIEKKYYVPRIIGKNGMTVKSIKKHSGAKVLIKKNILMISAYGTEEACRAAREMTEVLLGLRPVTGYENFMEEVNTGYLQDLEVGKPLPADPRAPSSGPKEPYVSTGVSHNLGTENNSNLQYSYCSSDYMLSKMLETLQTTKKPLLKKLGQAYSCCCANYSGKEGLKSLSQIEKYEKKKDHHGSAIMSKTMYYRNYKHLHNILLGQMNKSFIDYIKRLTADVKKTPQEKKVKKSLRYDVARVLALVNHPSVSKVGEVVRLVTPIVEQWRLRDQAGCSRQVKHNKFHAEGKMKSSHTTSKGKKNKKGKKNETKKIKKKKNDSENNDGKSNNKVKKTKGKIATKVKKCSTDQCLNMKQGQLAKEKTKHKKKKVNGKLKKVNFTDKHKKCMQAKQETGKRKKDMECFWQDY